jgi:hypothetical protein
MVVLWLVRQASGNIWNSFPCWFELIGVCALWCVGSIVSLRFDLCLEEFLAVGTIVFHGVDILHLLFQVFFVREPKQVIVLMQGHEQEQVGESGLWLRNRNRLFVDLGWDLFEQTLEELGLSNNNSDFGWCRCVPTTLCLEPCFPLEPAPEAQAQAQGQGQVQAQVELPVVSSFSATICVDLVADDEDDAAAAHPVNVSLLREKLRFQPERAVVRAQRLGLNKKLVWGRPAVVRPKKPFKGDRGLGASTSSSSLRPSCMMIDLRE